MVFRTCDNVFEKIDTVTKEEIEVAIFKTEVGVAVLDNQGEVSCFGEAAVLSCCKGDNLTTEFQTFEFF